MCVCVCSVSHVWFFAALWTVVCQAPLSMEFFSQEYWSLLPFPNSGIFPTQRLNPCLLHCLHWQADFLPLCHLGIPFSPASYTFIHIFMHNRLMIPTWESDVEWIYRWVNSQVLLLSVTFLFLYLLVCVLTLEITISVSCMLRCLFWIHITSHGLSLYS